jgi:hypothetical protein
MIDDSPHMLAKARTIFAAPGLSSSSISSMAFINRVGKKPEKMLAPPSPDLTASAFALPGGGAHYDVSVLGIY